LPTPDAAPDVSGFLRRDRFHALIDALRERGFAVLAPVERGGTVVYAEIERAEELPRGLRDAQSPGGYRLEPSGRDRLFDVVHGPESLKRHVFAPREELLQIEVTDDRGAFRARVPETPAPRLALLGARACDLAGLAVQDRIFLHDRYPDPYYAARRAGLLLVGVECTRSTATCFCDSMGTGPALEGGFDLALTELDDGFLLRTGSGAGREVAAALALEPDGESARRARREGLERCVREMGRRMDPDGLRDLLFARLEHPRWDDVAARCLSCGNCTLVCPTCFCHDERDEPGLGGRSAVRVRDWDSCFNREHAQVHGANFRPDVRARYRQWLVHKLAGWVDQFGSSGCVGCGRCITWCPVGIDITEEVAALRQDPA
jgi:ferredoxin